MFTKNDYQGYFKELEDIYKRSLIIYTDLLNELSDGAIKNKLLSMSTENMDAFRFVNECKGKFI